MILPNIFCFALKHIRSLNQQYEAGLFGILDMMITCEKGDQVCQANRF